jgi:hypothetical protein
MKKTNKVKMGPLGTPLGNPLAYFNSLKGKTKTEPKQTLIKAQKGRSGSGMGSMAADDAAFDAMMNPPTSTPIHNGRVDEPSPYRKNFPWEGFEKRAPINLPVPLPSFRPYEEEFDDGVKKPVSPWTPPSSDRNGRVDERSPNREELDLIIKERNKLMKEYFENGQGMGSYPPPGHISGPPRQELPPFGPPRQSKGGSTNRMKKGGSHKMPNGKMMLNSAMKKGGLVKKKK